MSSVTRLLRLLLVACVLLGTAVALRGKAVGKMNRQKQANFRKWMNREKDSEEMTEQRESKQQQRRNKFRDVTELCPCAIFALSQMDRILRKHHADAMTKPISDVMEDIEAVAKECTRQESCRCPEGYNKTPDGFSCLMISTDDLNCERSNQICEEEHNGKLAVAKNQEALTTLSNFIKAQLPDSEEFYWIGLSYNQTVAGSPIWKWEDGSKAEYDITERLEQKSKVKKSMVNFGDGLPIERVAISKNFEGAHWKQERCGSNYENDEKAMHKYICEYSMFKVEIMSEN